MKLKSVIKMGAFLYKERHFNKRGKFCGGVVQEVSKSEMFLLMELGSGKIYYNHKNKRFYIFNY